jgi:hypothetical protein
MDCPYSSKALSGFVTFAVSRIPVGCIMISPDELTADAVGYEARFVKLSS